VPSIQPAAGGGRQTAKGNEMGPKRKAQERGGVRDANRQDTDSTRPDPDMRSAQALYADLARAESFQQLARLLHERLGLEQAAIARAAGLEPSTISRWLDQERAAEDVRKPGTMGDLRYVVLSLLQSKKLTIPMLRFWLKLDPDPVLGTEPLRAISEGRFLDVVEAGLALTDPLGPKDEQDEIRRRIDRARKARDAAATGD
jgi:hypothetical protein